VSDAPAAGRDRAYLGYAVVRLAHALGREMERRLAPLGLTPTSFSALFHLAHNPEVSAAALARLILVTPQSVGPLLASLADAGLVVRERGAGPRGAIHSSLTGAGRDRLDAAQRVVAELDDELVALVPGVDPARLAGQLQHAAEHDWSARTRPSGTSRS